MAFEPVGKHGNAAGNLDAWFEDFKAIDADLAANRIVPGAQGVEPGRASER